MPATLDCFRACSCWGGLYGLLCRHPFSPAECYLGILSHLPLAMAYDFSKGGQIYIYCMIHSPLLGECERGFTPTTHRSFGSGAFRSACSMRYGTLWCMIFLFAVSLPLFILLFRSYLLLFRSYLLLFRSLLLAWTYAAIPCYLLLVPCWSPHDFTVWTRGGCWYSIV